MLYESFRNKSLNNGDPPASTDDHSVVATNGDHDNNGYNGCNNDSNENGMETTNGTDSNQNRESDGNEMVAGDVDDVESAINENVEEKSNLTKISSTRDETGGMNMMKTLRSGKPWMFGVHKNPKVVSLKSAIGCHSDASLNNFLFNFKMQLSVPKESDIGFTLTELQNEVNNIL